MLEIEIVPLIIFTGVISAIGINGAPTAEMDKDMIIDKFLKIKVNCLEYRDSYNNQNNKSINQTLCVMVMSDAEVHKKDEFPSGRIKYILNKKRNDTPFKYGNGKVHGEIQAIRLDNDIHKLIQTLNNESKTVGQGLPYVFVYSYFIPCAYISNMRYSCAEELATHARLNIDNFNMLVGYSNIFEFTDQNLANDYLHQSGGIFALVELKMEETIVEMETDQQFFEPNKTVFQEKLHNCILSKHVQQPIIVRNKINCMVQKCTSESLERGPLTHLGMWFMHDCFEKIKFSFDKKHEKFELIDCLLDVMVENYKDGKTLLVLGKPNVGTDEPYWTRSEDINAGWNLVYNEYQPPADIEILSHRRIRPLSIEQQMTKEIRSAYNKNLVNESKHYANRKKNERRN